MLLRRKIILFAVLCLLPSFSVSATETYEAPKGNAFKTYMDAKTITNKSSAQYALQQEAETLDNGLRALDDRYMVAIGTGFNAEVGDYVDVHMESGNTLKCIVGDIKAEKDTDESNKQIPVNGNVVEFIVDTKKLDKSVKYAGDVSKINGFEGEINTLVIGKEEEMKEKEDPEEQESVNQTSNLNNNNYTDTEQKQSEEKEITAVDFTWRNIIGTEINTKDIKEEIHLKVTTNTENTVCLSKEEAENMLSGLKLLKQYREIGTVEECRAAMESYQKKNK